MLMDFSVSTRTRFPEIRRSMLFFIQWTDKFVWGDGLSEKRNKEPTVSQQVLLSKVGSLIC